MPLPAKPLEITDFSGGITDNVLQGDPRRSEELDNLYITTDKKLIEREGIVIYSEDGAQLPEVNGVALKNRINGYFSFINETQLMAQSSRQIFYANLNKSWTEILGVAGNPALEGGDLYSQTTYSEFQRKIYLATDGSQGDPGVLPSKIYRDEDNAWVAKTAGLPRCFIPANYNDGTLLAKCIAVANDLRARFIEHLSDAAYDVYTDPYTNTTIVNSVTLHLNKDRYSLSYFATQSFAVDEPQPDPIPTPAPAATNEATLYALIVALNAAYTHHVIEDARQASRLTPPPAALLATVKYHWATNSLGTSINSPAAGLPITGPHATLNNVATPDNLEDAAAMLDDLHQKYNWHRKGIWVHSPNNNPVQFDKYGTQVSKIGSVYLNQRAPDVTPDFSDIYNFANNLRYLYRMHVSEELLARYLAQWHKTANNGNYNLDLDCYLPEADDLDSAFLLIYWLRSLYYLHYLDSTAARQTQVTFTTVLNSANISAVNSVSAGATTTLNPGDFLYAPTVTFSIRPGSGYAAKVISSALGTAVLDRPITSAAGTLRPGAAGSSVYHNYQNPETTFPDSSTSPAPAETAMGEVANAVATNTAGWLTLGEDLFNALSNHMRDTTVHILGESQRDILYPASIYTVPYPNFIIPEMARYSYAFFFSDEYTVEPNGIEYLVQGNPVLTESLECVVSYPPDYIIPNQQIHMNVDLPILTQRANVISNIPVLTNNSLTNYDVSNIKVNIYRTTDGGNTWYLLDQVNNGTTSYTDTTNDSISGGGKVALILKQPMYTTGGIVGHDQPPECKFTHTLDGFTYYGAVTDTGQYFPNRIRQSVQYAPDAAPATFYDDLDDELVGLSSTRENLLAFCKNSIYRMEGSFNSQGQGSLRHERISDTLGCLNAKSIVRTEIGVFYAGSDGFYYTDAFQNIKISLEIDDTYLALTKSDSQKRSIYGGYDKLTRRVWWALKEYPTDTENSVMFGFYLDFGTKPSGTFTTMSNGTNFRPASFVFQNGVLHIGHEKGYLLKTDIWAKTDAEVDLDVSPENWETKLIPYNWTSTAMDLGTAFNRKWITKIHAVTKNNGNVAAQLYALRDLNQTSQGAIPLAPINYTENFTWGKPNFIWGDSTCRWKTDGKMDLWRRFPATTLRSDFMQLKAVPAEICVYASSIDYPDFSFATSVSLGGGLSEVTIATPSGYTDIIWPLDVVGYEICFSSDDYETSYPIVSVTDNELVVEGNLTIASPGLDWEIWGVKKEQKFSLTSVDIHFAYLGDKNQKYPGPNSNDGAGNAGGNP